MKHFDVVEDTTTTLSMAYKLMTTAESKWRRLLGYAFLADVIKGVKFKDGDQVDDDQRGIAAWELIHQIRL